MENNYSVEEILSAISEGNGPRNYLLALGYAGWAPGQLDTEIHANGWLIAPSDTDIIFSSKIENKWYTALSNLGIDITMLSSDAGHARYQRILRNYELCWVGPTWDKVALELRQLLIASITPSIDTLSMRAIKSEIGKIFP